MDPDAPAEEALSVLTAYPADLIETWTVSTLVNRAGSDKAEMVHRLGDERESGMRQP